MWFLLFLVFLPFALSVNDGHDHLHECTLCPCFVKYADRDIWIPKEPYRVVSTPQNITLDRCLQTCLRDRKCKAVVNGLVGGRHIYTCELYKQIDPMNSPHYTPYVDAYLTRNMPCMVDSSNIKKLPVEIPKGDLTKAAIRRKQLYEKLYSLRNPFY